MAFFQIQNHEIPIAYGKASSGRAAIGDSARSFEGTPLITRRALKNFYDVTTALIPPAHGIFLQSLLDGEGHTFNFNDSSDWRYSSKGLAPDNITGASRHTAATKYGTGALALTAGSDIAWDVGYAFEWTAMVWVGASGGASFPDHVIVNSGGAKYENGVRNDGLSTPYINMASGIFSLGDTGSGATQYFDDLVLIPADIPQEWAEDFGVGTNAFSALPRLRMTGSLFRSRVFNVEVFDPQLTYTGGTYEGTWYPDLTELKFTVQEINRVS